MNKLFILMMFLLISFTYAISGQEQSLGTFRQGECVELIQTCSNCTFNNISSVMYPNSSLALNQATMTKTGTFYNYTFCSTSPLGEYIVNGFGDLNGLDEIWAYSFLITPAGENLETGQALLYMFMLIVFISIFLLSFYGSIVLPWKNERNPYDEIIKVNYRKYLKMFCMGMSYVFLVWVSYISWNLSWGYLHMRGIADMFRYLFTVLVALALPVFIIWVVLMVVVYINDQKIQSFINKEFPIQ